MPLIEWQGQVRITVGELTRAEQIDVFKVYSQSEWYEATLPENPAGDYYAWRLMETDAIVAAAATRKIEICKGGKWVTLKSGDSHTVTTEDGDSFDLSYPISYTLINRCPRSLGDKWIEASAEKNGGINANMTFFSSITVRNGKTNSEPESDESPSNTPPTATS